MRATKDQLFSVLVRDGIAARLFISATYCLVGKQYDFDGSNASLPATVSLIFDGLSASAGASITVALESSNGSAYAPDYSCVRIRAKSAAFNTSITFSAVYVQIQPSGSTRLRRGAGIGEAIYEPLQGSALVQYQATSPTSTLLAQDSGAWLTIDDVLAPQFTGCPTATLYATAAGSHDYANVTWYVTDRDIVFFCD